MQKYIAIVHPRMDDDEISKLIAKDMAGALFQISHQNYPLASKLIEQVKRLSHKHHRPISLIQDISGMDDDLDLQFGLKSGADWVVTDTEDHLKLAKGLDKLAKVIYKGRNLPKSVRVDSVMADSFLDPDAEVIGHKAGQIKHMISPHKDQHILDTLLDISHHAGAKSIAVSDLDLAKSLSWRRPNKKIIFVPKNHDLARRAAIYWGVHPVYFGTDLSSTLKHAKIAVKGDRVVDAMDAKHVAIHLVP